jgi:peptide/nickel transport system ATP-binding protein
MIETHPLLRVEQLHTVFRTGQGPAHAVDGVSFEVYAGKTLALVGESGCGKSVTALSILRLVPSPPGEIRGGVVWFGGNDLLQVPERALRTVRGNDISMIFQEPMSSMNPVFRVGDQVASVLRLHRKLSKAEARAATITLFQKVGISAPERRIQDYPHQMSGGMLQRVMIAMALACNPKLLIADEPTTALDVTIQAQIMRLLKHLQEETGMGMLLITHDLGIVAEAADEVAVMYAGQIVERAPVQQLFDAPSHPYTRGLFASLPAMNQGHARLYTIPGSVPPATAFPKGCRFAPRCPHAMARCRAEAPPTVSISNDHTAACWLHDPAAMAEEGRPLGFPAGEVTP